MPPSPDDDSVLAGLTPAALPPEQVQAYEITRSLITQALAAQSARRHELEQNGGDPHLLEQVIATQNWLARALQDLDPADSAAVTRVHQKCAAILREAPG